MKKTTENKTSGAQVNSLSIAQKIYTEHKPLESFHPKTAWLYTLTHWTTAKAFFSLIFCALRHFFIIQALRKLRLTSTPIVNVDHPLDEKVPFTTERVAIYLDFVNFYVRLVSYLIKTLGKNAKSYCAKLLTTLATLYKIAATIYRDTMSTTRRPHYKGNFHFLIIHMFDPHYLCVPSLHVTIVTACFVFVRDLIKEGVLSNEDGVLEEVRAGALRIIESVLYIKQHSINCVATSFYMLSATGVAGTLSAEEVKGFLEELFSASSDSVTIEDAIAIRTYIEQFYEGLSKEYQTASSWQEPILNFLHSIKG